MEQLERKLDSFNAIQKECAQDRTNRVVSEREVPMVKHKPKLPEEDPSQGGKSCVGKQETTWLGAVFTILRKGGKVTKTVKKTTVYEVRVSDK